MNIINGIAFILLIIGGLNWGLVGLANFDLVQYLLGGTAFANAVYIAIGVAAVWKAIFCCCCNKSSCSK